MEIKILSEDLRTRITSGINITSFLKCVSELVFNSLDSKATAIAVRVNLFQFQIQVVDNGGGISSSNMTLIGVQHMTNKCYSISDFYKRCKYYGCKGESLASIRTMSRILKISSRPDGETDTLCKIFRCCAPPEVIKVKKRSCTGTTVTVEGLLFNHGVRRNRVNTYIELEEIKRFLQCLAIIHPNVSFTLRNETNGTVLLECPKTSSVSSAIAKFCPDVNRHDLHETKVKKNSISVAGLIYSKLLVNNTLQFVYINKRPVNGLNDSINHSILKEFRVSDDNSNKHPGYVINISCPRSELDSTQAKCSKDVLKCLEKLLVKVHTNPPSISKLDGNCNKKRMQSLDIKIMKGRNCFGDKTSIVGNTSFHPETVETNKSQTAIAIVPFNLNLGNKLITDDATDKNTNRSVTQSISPEKIVSQNKEPDSGYNIFSNGDYDIGIFHDLSFLEARARKRREKLNKPGNLMITNKLKAQNIVPSSVSQNVYDLSFVHDKARRRWKKIKKQRNLIISYSQIGTKSSPEQNNFNFEVSTFYRIEDTNRNYICNMAPSFHINNRSALLVRSVNYSTVFRDANDYKNNTWGEANARPQSLIESTETNNTRHDQNLGKKLLMNEFLKSIGDAKTLKKRSTLLARNVLRNDEQEFDIFRNNNECEAEVLQSFSYVRDKGRKRRDKLNRQGNLVISNKLNGSASTKENKKIKPKRRDSVKIKNSFKFEVSTIFRTENNKHRNHDFIWNATPSLRINNRSSLLVRSVNYSTFFQPHEIIFKFNTKQNPSTFNFPKITENIKGKPNGTDFQKDTITYESHYRSNYSARTFRCTTNTIHRNRTNENESEYTKFKKDLDKCFIVRNKRDHARNEIVKYSFAGTRDLTLAEIGPDLASSLQKNESKHLKTDKTLKSQLSEEWIKQDDDAKIYYLNKRTGMSSSLRRQSQTKFTLQKRFQFIPKGLSPVIKHIKSIDTSLQSTIKRKLRNAIITVYDNDREILENSINKEDLQDFLEKRYSENHRKFGTATINIYNDCVSHETYSFTRDLLNGLEVIGQLDFKYIVTISTTKIIFLFDQHAMHERILLEKLLKGYTTICSESGATKYRSTSCDRPLIIECPTSDTCMLRSFKQLFENLGLSYDISDNQILMRRVPTCFYNKNCKITTNNNNDEVLADLVKDLIAEEITLLRTTRGTTTKIPGGIRRVINSEACRNAIKFGDKLELDDCLKYIEQLSACTLPFNCAHGRPTLVPTVKIGDAKENILSRFAPPNLKKLLNQ